MSIASIRALIYAVVNSVPDVGQVHDYFRWTNDVSTLYDRYKSTVDGVAQLRGWALSFQGFDQTQEGLGRDDKDTQRLYHWRLDGWMGLDDSAATEKTFDNLIETVCEFLDGSYSLNTSTVCLYREPTDCTVDHVIFAGNLCHHAVILFDIMEDSGDGRLLFYDSFTDTTGVLLSAHTPDLNRPGGSWDAGAASNINSNSLYISGPPNNAVVDVGVADLTIEAVINNLGSRYDLGLCVRETDVDNCWIVCVDMLNTPKTFYIADRQAAAQTTRATTNITFNTSDDVTIKAVVKGSTIKAYYSDESGNSAAVIYTAATFQQTETTHGLYILNTPSVSWDYVKMWWAATDD